MRKSHTTFSRLTADTFNLHKMFGDGVIAVGQFSVVGTDIIVPSYTVQYNGIIVEETSPQTVAFTATDNYVCVHGIDASETSTPTIEALPAPLGVILLERAGATGWRSAKPLTITNGRRQQSFRRIADGSDLYLSYGAGYGEDDTRGTVRNIAIDSLDQLPFDDMTVGESLAAAGSIPWAVGVTGWASCKNAFMYTDGVDTFIQYEPDIMGIMPLQILAVVPTVMSVCALSPTRFAYAYYDAAVPNVVIVNSWTAGNPAPDGVDISITLPFDPVDVDILSGTEIVAQDATGIIIQATFNSVGTLSNIRNSVTRDTYFINNGHLSFTDTLGDVYLDWSYVKPAYGAFSYAMNNGEEIIELDVIGANHVAIQNGCVTKVIPTSVFGTGRFLVGDKIVIATSGMMGGISARFYDTKTYSTSVGISTSGMFLIDLIETDNYFVYYNGTDRVSLNHSPTSVGSLVEQSVDIQGRALCRYGKKELHLRSDVDYLYMYSNTHLKTSNYVNTMAFVGTYAGGVPITPIPNAYYTVIDRETYDGDHFLFLGGMTKGYACETPDGVPYGVVPGVVADIVADQFSGDMYVEGGWYIGMTVNATDTVISNARIMNLTIEHVRNVNFIGCDILAYTDVVDPLNNTYKFIGCTIGGIPANTFLALTDTPGAYGAQAGLFPVVNAGETALEFATVIQQNTAAPADPYFSYLRRDVDGDTAARITVFDEPASLKSVLVSGDPAGFENQTDSTVSYNPGTKVLTLSPSGGPGSTFSVWQNGVRYTFSAPVVWTAHGDTAGAYFFYFNSAMVATTSAVDTAWSIMTDVPVAYVIYNEDCTPKGIPFEERHTTYRNRNVHKQIHKRWGAYVYSGCTASGYAVFPTNVGTDDTQNQYATDQGELVDEDLENVITAVTKGTHTIFYRQAHVDAPKDGKWAWKAGTTSLTPAFGQMPYSAGAAYIHYNPEGGGAWGLVELSNDEYMNYYVHVVNSQTAAYQVINIPGQQKYANLTSALSENITSLAYGNIPFQEVSAIYRFTYRARAGYTSTGKVALYSVTRLTDNVVNSIAASASSHASLSGLTLPNSHPATAIGYNNQTEVQTIQDDVQAALDELYNINVDEASFTSPATFETIDIASAYTDTSAANDIISVTADVIGAVTELGFGSGGVALKDAFHRRFDYQAVITAGVLTLLGSSDETIFYEAASFENARLNPAVYLGGAGIDYVSVHTDGSIRVRGINWGGASSTVRYAVRFDYNKVSHVP